MEGLSLHGVKSLFQSSVVKVVEHMDVPGHLDDLTNVPSNVKERILYLMSKRGLITDHNISQMLHANVRQLDLSDCDNIGDESLNAIANSCPALQKIDLNSTKPDRLTITSQGVMNLARGCPHLQVVYLRRCTNINDEAIVELSLRCKRLRDLNIGGCVLLTDRMLQVLGENSHFLRSINFAHSQVSDVGVLSLVSGQCGKTLKEIHINHCLSLTDEAVEAVVQFCAQIDIFIFNGCPRMTDQSRVALEEVLNSGKSHMKQLTWTIY